MRYRYSYAGEVVASILACIFCAAIFLAPSYASAQDVEITFEPTFQAEHAGFFLYDGNPVDPYAFPDELTILSSELTSVDGEWTVNELSPWPRDVPQERGVYILARVGADSFVLDGAPVRGENYDIAHVAFSASATSTHTFTLSMPFFGDPTTPSGSYVFFAAELPETKTVYDPETEAETTSPYTDDDLAAWLADPSSPSTFGPTASTWEAQFEYINDGPPPCTENCFSNVLFLPGIKGSILKSGSDTLWPPTVWSNDVPQLALTEAGESANDVQVDGVLDTFYGTPIYSPFSSFMDGLVSGGVIEGWLPLAYDWRFMPETVLNEGIETPEGTIHVLEKIEELAADSKSGKVTIVAHSMGGLLGKAIIKRLQQEGKDGLIDAFVMVGSPQIGTPQAIAAILHGDGEGLGAGFIVRPADARTISQNMPSAYSLLPSPAYFGAVTDPVITFDTEAEFTELWRVFWGDFINTYHPFVEFLTGQGVTRTNPSESLLRVPEILRTDLVSDAAALHATYDSYEFPEHIRVVQVAGWGRPTVKAVEYRTNHSLQSYGTLFTREGDSTVVYPSAISSVADETYFFNLDLYREPDNKQAQHRDLLSTSPMRDLVKSVVKGENFLETNLVLNTKPQVADLDDELVVSTHSPVILGAYDESGNFTGINPNQDLSAEILTISENIPGSSFLYTSETQHIFLPKTGTYTFVYKGVGSGPTSVTIENFSADTTTPVVQYSDIPTTEDTDATFAVSSAAPEETVIRVDVDGDNVVDQTVAPDGTEPSLTELLALIKEKILALEIKDKLKQNLLKKIANLEKKIEAKKLKNARVLANFKGKISKQTLKGRIALADANEIVALLELLEAQSDNVALDMQTIVQLKQKILSLNIKANLKNNLLKRVAKLENKHLLINTLASLTKNISKKATNGNIADVDAQMLIDLLGQIENAI